MKPLLAAIHALKTRLDALRDTLDNASIRAALSIELVYESNKIEGNTLTLRETQLVVNEGITIGGKTVREHLEAINHSEAIDLLYDIVGNKVAFTEVILKQIHGLVLHGIDRDNAGIYRRVPVMIAGSENLPPQPYLLQPLMEAYFAFYETNKNTLHPVILAAEMHERLVNIHPFIDGNGRTSRLVMNLILLQHGYPLAILKGDYDSRIKYYEALEMASAHNDTSVFHQFIVDTVHNSLQKYLSILGEELSL